MSHRISIALATYNGARFLPQQLESLAAQQRLPNEVVVGDDGSTDDTAAQLRDFARRAPFPVHIRVNETRLGYAENFLQISARCQGDLIAFCDQDDVWSVDKLRLMERSFARKTVLLACHEAAVVSADLQPLGWSVRSPRCSPFDIVPGCTMLFRQELLEIPPSYRFDPMLDPTGGAEGLPHDLWIWFLAGTLGTLTYVPRDLVRYRQHGANLFGSGTQNSSRRTPHGGFLRNNYRELAARAARWSEFVHRRVDDEHIPQRWRAAFGRSVRRYRALSQALRKRATLYDTPSGLGSRIRVFTALLARAAYGRQGLGYRAGLKDLIVTVAHPFLERPSP